jgi:tripartite-type tricarboxylate transporter receptor subunit TctC
MLDTNGLAEHALRLAVGGALLAAAICFEQPLAARAQSYPDRTVHMIVAFPAGGTLDTLARIVAQKLSEKWNRSVLVENRPGAGGNIGAAAAARAAPDGYTLHFGAQSLAVNVTISPYEGFDPVRDFDPIILVATAQDVLLVPAQSSFHSVSDLVEYARAHPGKINYASLGPGTSAYLATALFSELAGIRMQNVSYSSLAQAATDLISGQVSLFIPTLGGHVGNIKSGNIRALAVSGAKRAEQLPDVPTFKELGVPFVEETSWYGIFAPKGTPRDVIVKVNEDVADILASTDVRQRTAVLGFRLLGGTPDKLRAMLNDEIDKWATLAKNGSMAIK